MSSRCRERQCEERLTSASFLYSVDEVLEIDDDEERKGLKCVDCLSGNAKTLAGLFERRSPMPNVRLQLPPSCVVTHHNRIIFSFFSSSRQYVSDQRVSRTGCSCCQDFLAYSRDIVGKCQESGSGCHLRCTGSSQRRHSGCKCSRFRESEAVDRQWRVESQHIEASRSVPKGQVRRHAARDQRCARTSRSR